MIRWLPAVLILCAVAAFAAPIQVPVRPKPAAPKAAGASGDFSIKRPGEITFTTGVTIEGHVEKPQVVLVLSKEKVKLNPLDFKHDLLINIIRPLNVVPFELYSEKAEKK